MVGDSRIGHKVDVGSPEPHEMQALASQWRRASYKPWTWSVQSSGQAGVLRGEGSVFGFRTDNGSDCLPSAVLGARLSSSLGDSKLARGKCSGSRFWLAFATTEEGVHCLGYDELLEAGIQPEEIVPQNVRLFGKGGASLPLDNDTERPLDVPQQNVVLRGLDDGSFDPGDELCWYAPSHETWDWDQDDGWTHQSPFWGDTAKWFLRTDAPQDLTLATVQTLPPLLGDVDEVRHSTGVWVEEDQVNLIRSGRNWFGDRLSALAPTPPPGTFRWRTPCRVGKRWCALQPPCAAAARERLLNWRTLLKAKRWC